MNQSINIQYYFENAHTLIIATTHQFFSYIIENVNHNNKANLIVYNYENKTIYMGEFGKQLSVFFFIEKNEDIHLLKMIIESFRIEKIYILSISSALNDRNLGLSDVLIADGIVNIERSKNGNEFNYSEEKSLYSKTIILLISLRRR